MHCNHSSYYLSYLLTLFTFLAYSRPSCTPKNSSDQDFVTPSPVTCLPCSGEAANASIQQSVQVVPRLRPSTLPHRGRHRFLPQLRHAADDERSVREPPLCRLRDSAGHSESVATLPPDVARYRRGCSWCHCSRCDYAAGCLQNAAQHTGCQRGTIICNTTTTNNNSKFGSLSDGGAHKSLFTIVNL